MPLREQNSNKGTFGKVLNFAGSKNYIGAAYLSTVAILKVGAGFAALASEENIIRSVSTLLPEAVYLSRKEGLSQIKDFSVVLIGCGLGTSDSSKDLFKDVMKLITPPPRYAREKGTCFEEHTEKSLVIDADGLNILAEFGKESQTLTPHPNHLLKERKFATIITPHPLEAARLLGVELENVLNDLEGSARKLCKKYNCITVLKTHRTLICNGEEIFVNQHGNSALAKAGSGDVLAGIIAGLLAQKMEPYKAAKLGVYLHSRAGEIASEDLTEYSVLASDLPKYLPQAIKEIL